MSEPSYTLAEYVADIRKIVAEERDDQAITARIAPLAKKLATAPGWIKPEYRTTDPVQGFGVHLLHEEPNHDLAVMLLAWAPNRGTLPHNHKTWAVVAGIEGQEREVEYKRLDDGKKPGHAKLEPVGACVMTKGDLSTCVSEDIHSVWNVGSEVALSLHTYGRHLNHTGRSEFDVAAEVERPFIVKVEKH